jgi:hypothetical protein
VGSFFVSATLSASFAWGDGRNLRRIKNGNREERVPSSNFEGDVDRSTSVVLSHGARIVLVCTAMITGTFIAFDDQTLGELWRINIGPGFNVLPFGLLPFDDVTLAPVNADLVRNVLGARRIDPH